MKKRIFSLLLALCLAAGLLPTVAYAAEPSGTKLTKDILESPTYKQTTLSGDYIYVLPSGNYYLGEDILVDTSISIGDRNIAADVTLDLKGYTLRNDTNSTSLLRVNCDISGSTSTLTLMDSSSAKTGNVVSSSGTTINLYHNSKLNANGGTVGGEVLIYSGMAIDNTDPSNTTVFTGVAKNYGIINGGTFNGTVVNVSDGSISNGTFNGTVNNDSTTSTINGGTFHGPIENYGIIKGGIFYGTVSNDDTYGTIEDSAKVTVAFNSAGGSTVDEQKVLRGQKATTPTTPTKTGYSFNGWYQGNANTSFDFANTPVTENITLTAKWSEKSSIIFNTTPQPYTYDGSAQAFSITGTAVTGFDISYKQNGQIVTNPTDAGSYDVIVTRDEDDTYKAVNVTISGGLVIEPAAPTENPAKKNTARVVRGRTLADATVTNGEFLALDGTTPLTGTFAWVDSTKVMRADGTEQMIFTPDNANYAPIPIDVAVSTYSSGGSGGGSRTSTYTIHVERTENGTVTMNPKTAAKGATVTLTVEPDKGYTLETLTVTDGSGNEIELTDKGDGKYTFKMPGSKVTVKATFMEDNSMLNFFVDVFPGDYYYDAVLWAAENGITGGVNDVHFAPNAPCTRAQIVTFLWRAAGSPEPETMSSFADVTAESYYAKAVAWAVEQGITIGIGDGTAFSPNTACTRGQIVTFLWRSRKSPAPDGVDSFTDVAADAYYAGAVLWAVANGITTGTSDTTFSPGEDCTRAQIVTFLYRFFVK